MTKSMQARVTRFSVALLIALGAGQAHAKTLIGSTFLGARDFNGVQAQGALDLDAEKSWEANLNYSHQHSMLGSLESRTNQLSAGTAHYLDMFNEVHAAVNLTNDTINKIYSAGPSAGIHHVWRDLDTGEETFGLIFDTELFFYAVPVDVLSLAEGSTSSNPNITTQSATVNTTQFHPNLTLQKPLFKGVITPFVTFGRYFYSTDPAAIATVVERLGMLFTSPLGLYSMAASMPKYNWSTGSSIALTDTTHFRFEFGRNQYAADNSWATIYNLRAEQLVADHWQVSVGWSHAIQQEVPIDFGTLGLGYMFGELPPRGMSPGGFTPRGITRGY